MNEQEKKELVYLTDEFSGKVDPKQIKDGDELF